jgi:RNA recognition motif-containing protein
MSLYSIFIIHSNLRKIFVGGLKWETPLENLRDHFEAYGPVIDVVIMVSFLKIL